MAEIDILDFLKTSEMGGVKLEMRRYEVQAILGDPDHSFSNVSVVISPIWFYAGIQFFFEHPNEGLEDPLYHINFRPCYLFGEASRVKVKRWIFRSRKGPSRDRLIRGLEKHKIAFQDTGLETAIYNRETQKIDVVEFQGADDPDKNIMEHFGTIVLISGVQIRYDELGEVINVITGSDWFYKGKEQNIKW